MEEKFVVEKLNWKFECSSYGSRLFHFHEIAENEKL